MQQDLALSQRQLIVSMVAVRWMVRECTFHVTFAQSAKGSVFSTKDFEKLLITYASNSIQFSVKCVVLVSYSFSHACAT